jgi:hypothetical protein
LCSLAVLLTLLGTCRAADKGLSRVQIARAGKAATALVVVKGRGGIGSAFCLHPSGFFLTNEHVAQGDLSIVLNTGQKTEKAYPARVIRSDKNLDLTLLRVQGAQKLPALTLGSDENLEELMKVVAFGFPFGQGVASSDRQYPAISVNEGSITSLRRKSGRLHRIQLDAALNPGNSGGPVLDKNGKVVGVVVAGIRGSGVNFAIPVSTVAGFVARPDLQFEPPLFGTANIHKPARFEARLTSFLPSTAPFAVDLILKPSGGKERAYRMKADGDTYRVTAVPVPAPEGPLHVRLRAKFEDGSLEASATDCAFKAGGRELKLSEVRGIRFGARPRVLLHDNKRIEGTLTGLDAVAMWLGGKALSVSLAKAVEVKCSPTADRVSCTLVIRQAGKVILRHSHSLTDGGLIKNPGFEDGLDGWTKYNFGPPARFDFDTDVTREGWQALRVTAPEPTDVGCYQDVLLKQGKWYLFSGWVRTRGLKVLGAPWWGTFAVCHVGGNDLIAKGENHGGDTEWTRISFRFRAPESVMVRIIVNFVGKGRATGTAWFDRLKLVEVGQPRR